jgi:hypothetical protein
MVSRLPKRALAFLVGAALALGAATAAFASNEIFTAGTGIAITVTSGAASRVISNNGVTSIAGTANQVNLSAATGAVTVSLIGPYTPSTYSAHAVLVGEGSSSISAIGPGTNGQILIGSTTADPVWGVPTCTGCTWATGAGSVTLTVNSGTFSSITNNPSCSAGYTILGTDVYIRAQATSGSDCTLNLPAASGNIGRSIVVKRTDANAHNVLLHPNGTDTIDGVNSNFTISIQYEEFAVVVGASGAWDVM